jgi:hypothetical protein
MCGEKEMGAKETFRVLQSVHHCVVKNQNTKKVYWCLKTSLVILDLMTREALAKWVTQNLPEQFSKIYRRFFVCKKHEKVFMTFSCENKYLKNTRKVSSLKK